LSFIIKRIAHCLSISIESSFLKNFKSFIFKNTDGLIKNEDKAFVFSFQNKFILFEKVDNSLIIIDDSFNVIGTVILN
jgi:hypothetical protein